jgi:hypothetical protein
VFTQTQPAYTVNAEVTVGAQQVKDDVTVKEIAETVTTAPEVVKEPEAVETPVKRTRKKKEKPVQVEVTVGPTSEAVDEKENSDFDLARRFAEVPVVVTVAAAEEPEVVPAEAPVEEDKQISAVYDSDEEEESSVEGDSDEVDHIKL